MDNHTFPKKCQDHPIRLRLETPVRNQEMMSSDSVEEMPCVFVCADDLHGLDDLSIMNAHLSIQEQASQVEAAIAFSELESARADYECLKRILENKDIELKALRKQVKQGKEVLSSLLLEKELAQGEAAKYKENLQMCIQFMVASSRGETNKEDTTSGNHCRARRDLRSTLSQRSHRTALQDGVHKRTSVVYQDVPRDKKELAHNSAKDAADFRKLEGIPVLRAALSRRRQVHQTNDANGNIPLMFEKYERRQDGRIAQSRPATSVLRHRRL